MHTNARPSSVRFDRFELDQAAGELYRDGRRVRLQEQPRQILVALLERPGELVTRDALRERLWKSDTFVDFEHGLNTAVKKVRQALGDSAEAPEYIETLAKRGYRFIGEVQSFEPAGLLTNVPPAPATESPVPGISVHRWLNRHAFWLTIVTALAIATIAMWLFTGRTNSLAVMPLRVITPTGGDSDYLGVGIADTITTRLANTREIALRPTSAVMPYRDAQSDPAHIAKSLGVRHLLLGTIQATPDSYRISLQLVRSDGVVEWGRSFDEQATGLLPLQDRIADEVVTALRLGLTPPQRQRLHTRYTANPNAYDKYLRGRALALNPSLSLAHLARMRAYYHLGLFDLAREEGRVAQQLDPTPSVEFSRLDVASDLFLGRYQPAVAKAKTLLARTDAPAVRHYLGLAFYYVGDGKGAREMLGSIMRGKTPDTRAQASLASVEAALGMEKEARARITAIEHGSDMDHHVAYSLGAAMAQLHDASASLTWLERAADTGFPCYPWVEKDPMLDPIRSDPGFVRLTERLRRGYSAAARRAN
jgi:DNA-binding winged helix-turn-helix (wHTH) protein/TolB-like protein